MWVVVTWMDNGHRAIDVYHTEEVAKREYEDTKKYLQENNIAATVRLTKVLDSHVVVPR